VPTSEDPGGEQPRGLPRSAYEVRLALALEAEAIDVRDSRPVLDLAVAADLTTCAGVGARETSVSSATRIATFLEQRGRGRHHHPPKPDKPRGSFSSELLNGR
jgi:hypothetical protein